MTYQPAIALTDQKRRVETYRDLVVWTRSMDLVELCYGLSRKIPPFEIYGLTSQIRRAAISIPANIAEGHGRRSLGEYIRHLFIANGSLKELETHLLIAGRLRYLRSGEIAAAEDLCSEIGKMLAGLIQKLRQKRP